MAKTLNATSYLKVLFLAGRKSFLKSAQEGKYFSYNADPIEPNMQIDVSFMVFQHLPYLSI